MRIFILLLIASVVFSATGAGARNPASQIFSAQDPYEGKNYQERPQANDESVEILTVDDLLKSTVPSFWKHKTTLATGLEINQMAELRARLDIVEKSLMAEIEQVPGVIELIEENRTLEAEIQNFLVLRRAELKDIHNQIRKVEEELKKETVNHQEDIRTVQDRIRQIYEEIDHHLEDPSSSYEDAFITQRKDVVKKLMRKKTVLREQFSRMSYPQVEKLQKKMDFLKERRKEIQEQSKDMSFKYVQKRLDQVEKNNARINYLVAMQYGNDRGKIKSIRAKLTQLREMSNMVKQEEKNLEASDNKQKQLESEVRFEENYYDRLAMREEEILAEIRRSREKIHSRDLQEQGSLPSQSQPSKNQGTAYKDSRSQKNQEGSENGIYVVPMKEGLDLGGISRIPEAIRNLNANQGIPAQSGGNVVYWVPVNALGTQSPAQGVENLSASDSGNNSDNFVKEIVSDVEKAIKEQVVQTIKDSLLQMRSGVTQKLDSNSTYQSYLSQSESVNVKERGQREALPTKPREIQRPASSDPVREEVSSRPLDNEKEDAVAKAIGEDLFESDSLVE